ncbi:ABC transporter ATP-binding protein [Micromonospora sp. NPDC050397]|uniref:ABC transporter ATP-binding protein n=1 Tax=Micromonospora sp. NPDC050397 TaxID=3364279 RepID=UPI00384FB11E
MRLDAYDVDWGVRGSRILTEVALTADPGATVGLLGPNGSGKSSLLRLLAGLGRPDAGRVLLDGEPLADLPRRRLARRIAVVHQQVSPDVDMSTLDVLLLGRIPHRPRLAALRATDLDLARRALADAGLAGFETRRWSALSGGERQRIDIARALLQEPDLLLLDEPTNHLDVRHQLELLEFLAGSAITVVVTLHDLDLAAQYCDKIVLLHQGRVVAAGTPVEVLTPERVRQVYQADADITVEADGRPRVRFRRTRTPPAGPRSVT